MVERDAESSKPSLEDVEEEEKSIPYTTLSGTTILSPIETPPIPEPSQLTFQDVSKIYIIYIFF